MMFCTYKEDFSKTYQKRKGTVAKIIFGKRKQIQKSNLLNFKTYSALITAQSRFCGIHREVNTRSMKDIKEHRSRNTQICPRDF